MLLKAARKSCKSQKILIWRSVPTSLDIFTFFAICNSTAVWWRSRSQHWELSDLVYCSSLSTLSTLLHPASLLFSCSPRLLLSRCHISADGFFHQILMLTVLDFSYGIVSLLRPTGALYAIIGNIPLHHSDPHRLSSLFHQTQCNASHATRELTQLIQLRQPTQLTQIMPKQLTHLVGSYPYPKVSLFLKVFVKFTDFFYCLLLWAICNFSYLVNCHVMTIFVVFIFGLNLFCHVSQSKPFKHKFYTSQSFLEICQGKVCPNSAGELLSMWGWVHLNLSV